MANQEGSAYNGYFECTCYHPLFCFNQYGDKERALLRNGNVHSADDWQSALEPIVERYRGYDILRFFRGDAGFADPHVYRCLEAEAGEYRIMNKEFRNSKFSVRSSTFRFAARPASCRASAQEADCPVS
jgi:hypothetical protein